MEARSLLTAVGSAIATFLLVAVLVIELLAFEFSAIVGLPVGLVAGIVALVLLVTNVDRLGSVATRFAGAYAALGFTVLALVVLRYANLGGARQLSTESMLGIALGVAVLTFLGLWTQDRR